MFCGEEQVNISVFYGQLDTSKTTLRLRQDFHLPWEEFAVGEELSICHLQQGRRERLSSIKHEGGRERAAKEN